MPTLISPDGLEYRTSNPVEAKRLVAGFGYREAPEGQPVFHPGEHSVEEVVKYMKDHPDEAERIVAEELDAEKPRKTITGD